MAKTRAKTILSDNDKQMLSHITKTLNVVKSVVGATLGPGGRPVLIERTDMPPLITKDGVTVIKNLSFTDEISDLILEVLKEISMNTAKEAGDGTTSSIVLAAAMFSDSIQSSFNKLLADNVYVSPQMIMRDLNSAVNSVLIPYIDKVANKNVSEQDLLHVAMISTNGDKELAEVAVEAIMTAGNDGHVLLDEGVSNKTYVDSREGFLITFGLKDLGGIGQRFINDSKTQSRIESDACFLLYDGAVDTMRLFVALNDVYSSDAFAPYRDKPLVIVAHSFSDEVLVKMSMSEYKLIPMRTPYRNSLVSRSNFLKDIAAYTGGRVYDSIEFESAIKKHCQLGTCNKIEIGMYETVIYNDYDEDLVEARKKEIKYLIDTAHSELDKLHLKSELAQLSGGVVTIVVGGNSDVEIREKKARVEDAVEALKSALSDGIVPGGATMFLKLSQVLSEVDDAKPAYSLLRDALPLITETLLANAGESPAHIVSSLREQMSGHQLPPVVYDIVSRSYVNPYEAGILEPAKVIKSVIKNAVSVTSLLMTLGGIVAIPRNDNLDAQVELSKTLFKTMVGSASEE